MAKLDLKLGQDFKEEYTNIKHNEDNYKFWREHRKNWNQTFFMVPSEILSYVSAIKSKAMSLYLYYSFRARNDTGKSWASVERAAEDLSISTKSVNNWNKELQMLGLIARVSENKSSKTTYLLPISDFYYFEKSVSPETYIEYSNNEIDGDLIGVFHLFQWRKKEGKEYTKP
ncbi:helix-turn-helix domain-containing protein, partial [Dellaglioa algida]|nr:helix-turn-helix domain-containing protein [Dellaglioa algida]